MNPYIKTPYQVRRHGDPWEELGRAVAWQAAKDWLEAVHTLKTRCGPGGSAQKETRKKAEEMREECEEFFRSRWFVCLTGANGRRVLRILKKVVGEP